MTKTVLVLVLGAWISSRANSGQGRPPFGGTVAASDDVGVHVLPLTGRGAQPALLSPLKKAMLVASDADDLYCLIPDFDNDPDRGVYRVDKRQGKTELIWRTEPHDQAIVAVDGAEVYLASWAKGLVYRFDKASGKRATFLRGQHHVVSMAADLTFLYWYCEGTAEVRRTPKKRAGKIEVVGRQVDTEPVVGHASGVYWFEGGPGPTGYRLMRLAPGAAVAIPVAKDLNLPSGLTVDDNWVYTADLKRELIVRLPQCCPAAQGQHKGSPHCIPPGEPKEPTAF